MEDHNVILFLAHIPNFCSRNFSGKIIDQSPINILLGFSSQSWGFWFQACIVISPITVPARFFFPRWEWNHGTHSSLSHLFLGFRSFILFRCKHIKELMVTYFLKHIFDFVFELSTFNCSNASNTFSLFELEDLIRARRLLMVLEKNMEFIGQH